ncbi:MAG TPA: DUF2062 domain-containing protein [Desulfobacteraceae bacterium]|nr:DUF2062 domain-containing protein [Deltaproteobacteria bacterium]HDI60010.1 DUF2062 domain-containing protein [Desulfobacteraceae bacterium]
MAERRPAVSGNNCSKDATSGFAAKGGQAGLLKRAYERFVKLRGCPKEIARGFAVGLFIGFMPILGAQMLIAVPLAALFKSNKLAAAAGVWITNPVTAPVIYGLTYVLGSKLTGISGRLAAGFAEPMTLMDVVAQAPHVFWTLTIGGIVVGLPVAVASYYLSLAAVIRYRERIQQKIAAGREKLIRRRRTKRKKSSKRR